MKVRFLGKGRQMRRFIGLVLVTMACILSACGLLVEQGRDVVAEVGGERVRLNDLLERIRELPFDQRAKTNDSNPSVRLQARRSVLEATVTEMLLAKEAEARNIKVSDEDVKNAFKELEAQQHSMENIAEGMKGADHEHGREEQEYSRQEMKQMRTKLMVQRMLREQFADAVMRKYYDEHTEEFSISPPLGIYEILIVGAENSKDVDRIAQKAAREGTTLAVALASVQHAPPVIYSGLMPPSPLGSLVPEMREKVENLGVGQISKPFTVHSPGKDGCAVVRVVGHVDKAPYENVRDRIYKGLFKSFVGELQQKYKVVYHNDKLNYQLGS